MQEESIYQAWQGLARSHKKVLSGSHQLQVVDSGRLNRVSGPDFLAARFLLDGIVYQGDVECHIQCRDWYAHGHHLDRRYRQVLLHVAVLGTTPVHHTMTDLPIPTIGLPPDLSFTETSEHPEKCPGFKHIRQRWMGRWPVLARMRLQRKTHAFSEALDRHSYDSLFYTHFLHALGYPLNAAAFQQLAGRLTWEWLNRWYKQFWSGPEELLALYLGQAGLLPQRPENTLAERLSGFYNASRAALPGAAMTSDQWVMGGQRPGNHPHFRLAGWVYLLKAHGGQPGQLLWDLLSRRLTFGRVNRELQRFFRISCPPAWAGRYSLNSKPGRINLGYFWGRQRSTEILLNVVIPLARARALADDSTGFADYLEELYTWLPAVSDYAGMRRFFGWAEAPSRQAQLQALLHLHHDYCLAGSCSRCPLKGKMSEGFDSAVKNN